jgi:hypothetical protein
MKCLRDEISVKHNRQYLTSSAPQIGVLLSKNNGLRQARILLLFPKCVLNYIMPTVRAVPGCHVHLSRTFDGRFMEVCAWDSVGVDCYLDLIGQGVQRQGL